MKVRSCTGILAVCCLPLASTAAAQADSARQQASDSRWRVLRTETAEAKPGALVAFLYANGFSGGEPNEARLVLRCQRNVLDAFVLLGERVRAADSAVAEVWVRWSDDRRAEDQWMLADNGLAIFAPNPRSFIEAGLLRHERVTIEVSRDSAGSWRPAMYEFVPSGLDGYMEEFTKECGPAWRKVITARAPDDVVRSYYLELEVDRKVALMPGTLMLSYPDEMRRKDIEGEVIAEYVISRAGRVVPGTIRIKSSTDPMFTAAVLAALRTARYYPAELQGRFVPQLMQAPFNFTLTR